MRWTFSRWSLCLLLLCLAAACTQQKATTVLVTITAKDGVATPGTAGDPQRQRVPVTLTTEFSHESEKVPNIFSKGGAEITFPTSLLVRADGRTGPIEVSAKVKDARDYALGEGLTTATLITDAEVDAELLLYPTDFPVNGIYTGSQFFSQTYSGRQLGAASDGSFVAVWEDDCPEKARCDIYYRMFDKTGTAKLNAVTGKTEENSGNETNDFYDMPAVAVQESGGFLLVWQRIISASNASKIYARAFTANGRPDPSANSGAEIELSGAEITGATGQPVASSPFAVTLKNKGYLVVWQQTTGSNNWELKARYLTASGMPAKLYNGSSDPFSIATMVMPDKKEPDPVAAAGANQGFLVAWVEAGARARAFGLNAQPLKSAFDVDGAKSGKVDEITAGSLAAGYIVAWTDSLSTGPDIDGTSIRARRLDVNGDAYVAGEDEYTVNTSVAGSQYNPAIATRSDGSVLIAWTTDHGSPDVGGGVRGRRVLHNFLPVGSDFSLNTTQTSAQYGPSLAASSSTTFVGVWVDGSQTYPDAIGTGIRGRLLYPEYAPTDGQIGALCEQVACATGLSCQPTEAGRRCVSKCGSGDTCPQGGVCRTLSGGGDKVCLYK